MAFMSWGRERFARALQTNKSTQRPDRGGNSTVVVHPSSTCRAMEGGPEERAAAEAMSAEVRAAEVSFSLLGGREGAQCWEKREIQDCTTRIV